MSSTRNHSGKDVIQPWWLDDNDSDLQQTAYDDDHDTPENDPESSRVVVPRHHSGQLRFDDHKLSRNNKHRQRDSYGNDNIQGQRTKPSLQYDAKSARRDKSTRLSTPAAGKPNKLNRPADLVVVENQINLTTTKTSPTRTPKECSSKRSTTLQEPTSTGTKMNLASSAPARERRRVWTETGKSKFLHAVDKIKQIRHHQGKDDDNIEVVRWTCQSCTYLNTQDKSAASPSICICEVCGTPQEVRETIALSSLSRLPGAMTYEDDIPCDPVDIIERTLNEENLDSEENDSHENSRDHRRLKQSLPFQNTFERWFHPKRQCSTTTTETFPMGSSEDLDRNEHPYASQNRTDTASSSLGSGRVYTVSELVASLGAVDSEVELPPALERRVRDFKFAQQKRRERHGDQKPWGIYGLYAHLSDIRADLEWAEDAAWRRQKGRPYLSWRDFDKSRDKGFHNRPWFIYAILALCTIMMFVTFGVNGWKFEPLNINPLIGPSSETLIKCGARDTNLIVNEAQWYRLFTPMILHAGLVHYVINMMALYFIGGAVEQSHGFASAAVLFIVPAVGGNILSAICLPQYISVGASGGIFGLIGGCIADISLNWNLLFLKTTTDADTRMSHFYVLLWLGMDVIVNCLLGFTPFVDNFTHLGGFMYGFCCGISTIEKLAVGFFGINADKCSRLGSTFMRFFGLIVSIIAIMVTTVVLVQSDGVTSPCHGCRYISCVPFPPNKSEKWWYCDDCDVVTADLFRSTDGSNVYEQVDIHCPNGEIEEILIAGEGINDKEVLRKALPSYCRAHCDDVFASN